MASPVASQALHLSVMMATIKSMHKIKVLSVIFLALLLFSCNSQDQYISAQQKLSSIYPFKKQSQEGDWLTEHEEKYQSFEEYKSSKPTSIDSVRNKIYIMLVGNFDSSYKEIVTGTADYLHAFYGLEIKFIQLDSNADIFKSSREKGSFGQLQLSARYIMDTVLKRQLPKDAATLIAFTTYDLYPGNDWNFIFGLGSLQERVGIWSMYRFGDPVKDKDQCLMLTIKTATHEIGHMFSLRHCVKYECCMNGSNSIRELNGHPVYFCPDCLAKICWNLHQDVKDNLERMYLYWTKHGNIEMANIYKKTLESL